MVRPSPTLARKDSGSNDNLCSIAIVTPILNSCLHNVTTAHDDLFEKRLARLVFLFNSSRAKYHEGFDRSALFTQVLVNLEHIMQRMGLDRGKLGFTATHRARVLRFE